VVVDGAADDTAGVARAHGAVVCDVPVNRGQGAALRLGYHLAKQRGARYIVTTDADGQYRMEELPLLLAPLLAGEADFVTGSRRLGANESTDRVRRLGTRVFAALVSRLTGHRVTDTSFGFRAMRAEVPVSVTLHQPQYQSAELLVGVLSHGYRVLERPMTMHRRNQGHSKKGNNLVYGLRYARVVFGTWWRERKTSRSSTRNLATNNTA
jgi:glycosyltransferase involved in cell wall biosynthesis